MTDPVETPSSDEVAPQAAPAPSGPGAKRRGRKAPAGAARPASRTAATVRTKLGGFVVTLPAGLAASLTAKDQKKLSALFKRAVKRQKRDSLKKRAAKKDAAKKGAGKKRTAKKRTAKKR